MSLHRRKPRKKPHPRSLDALYPKPKKRAAKFCQSGHRQAPDWRPGFQQCDQCKVLARLVEADRHVEFETQDEWLARNGPAPAVLFIPVVREGRTLRFSIPPHLTKSRARQIKAAKKRRSAVP